MGLLKKAKSKGKKGLLLFLGLPLLLLSGGGVAALYLGGGNGPSSGNQSTSINLNSGLVGWWKLNGNTKDSTPYGDNGVNNGAVLTTGRQGEANGAYSFNGSSYISIPASNILNNNSFSISAWIYVSSGQNAAIVGSSASGGPFLRLAGLGIQSTGCANGSTQAGVWANIVYTYSPSVGTHIFNDGQFSGGCGNTNYNFTWSNFVIGDNQGSLFFNGKISDVRIYNRVLNQSEISALYSGYHSEINTDSGQSGLVGWWKLNGNTKDSSPYGNNGSGNNITPTADREGQPNGAEAFGGTGSIIVADSSGLSSINSSQTVTAWVYATKLSGMQTITAVENNSFGPVMKLCISGSTVCLHSLGDGILLSGGTLTANSWHFIGYSFNATTSLCTIYVDGIPAAAGSCTPNTGAFQVLGIGAWDSGTAYQNFNGSIEDVRLYNRALSASEVTNLYSSYNSQIDLGGDGQSTGINLQKGLVGYWPFNGNAKDDTPYGNNGTVYGATLTSDRLGRANSAYSFDGTTSYIEVPNASILNVGPNATLCAWVDPSSSWQPSAAFIEKWDGSSANGFIMQRSQSTTGLEFFDGTHADNSLQTIPIGQWSLVCTVVSGTSRFGYINGSQVFTSASNSSLVSNSDPIYFGHGPNSGYFAGSMSDIRIYNRSLSTQEIQALYNESL